jgi:hypothetical protein
MTVSWSMLFAQQRTRSAAEADRQRIVAVLRDGLLAPPRWQPP